MAVDMEMAWSSRSALVMRLCVVDIFICYAPASQSLSAKIVGAAPRGRPVQVSGERSRPFYDQLPAGDVPLFKTMKIMVKASKAKNPAKSWKATK